MNASLGANEGSNARATPFTVNIFHSGGTGARPGQDGLSATAFPSGVRKTPVEITETIAPLLINQKEYRQDSGGAGAQRGGLGQIMEITHAEGAPFVVSAMFDRVLNPARGRDNGESGGAGIVRLCSGPALAGKGRQQIPARDSLYLEMPGGGGLGAPANRSVDDVAADVRDGFVSSEAARVLYRVAVGEDGVVDVAETSRLRS